MLRLLAGRFILWLIAPAQAEGAGDRFSAGIQAAERRRERLDRRIRILAREEIAREEPLPRSVTPGTASRARAH